MADWTISAQTRTERGRPANGRLRRKGLIPAVVYGKGGETHAVSVPALRIHEVLHSERGENTILTLDLDGGASQTQVLIKDFQLDPIESLLLHADFVRIDMTKEIHVAVPIHLTGNCLGVKLDGGILDWTLREMRVICLPADIPDAIPVDVTELRMGKTIRVRDIVAPEKVRFLDDLDRAVAHVEHPQKEEEVAAPSVEGAPVAEPVEPELSVKKGKEPKEGEEGAEAEGKGDKKK